MASADTVYQPDPRLANFGNFLYLIWKHVKLPKPSTTQYDIAAFLQDKQWRRKLIEAFRGVGKSWITDAFVAYLLYNDPNKRILLVSASSEKAEQSLSFIKYLLNDVPFLNHLKPRDEQRNTVSYFDVNGAEAAEAPSVRAAGITGQITGARADVIVADDVEIPRNSLTVVQRDRLAEAIKEFESIIKPGGTIIYLGTPQTEQSIYNLLPERGYTVRIWPARVPKKEEAVTTYSGRLAPTIQSLVDAGKEGQPTEPDRFTDQDLFERELSYGRSGFRLQFMLDTRLTDANRYPLRCSDAIVMDLNTEKAPQEIIWTSAPMNMIADLPCVGLSGDRWYSPQYVSNEAWMPYEGAVLAVDPSGRGKDETGWAVVKHLHGYLFLLDAGGMTNGYTSENLQMLANKAKEHKVHKVIIESNFGDGMFRELFLPYINNTHPTEVEEIRALTQKETRICDTLEPVLNQHRLIINKRLIQSDYQKQNTSSGEDNAHQYQLFWQMSRITRERGSLPHDDRIDALTIAVGHFTSLMAIEANKQVDLRKQMLVEQELERFMAMVNKNHGPRQHSLLNYR